VYFNKNIYREELSRKTVAEQVIFTPWSFRDVSAVTTRFFTRNIGWREIALTYLENDAQVSSVLSILYIFVY
jgi:hypothetical protein